MEKVYYFLMVFVVGEVFTNFFTMNVLKASLKLEEEENKQLAVVKGIIERLVLFMGIVSGIPQIMIAFGALKLGTRFSNKEEAKTNTYFFLGNFLSLFTAITYNLLYIEIQQWGLVN